MLIVRVAFRTHPGKAEEAVAVLAPPRRKLAATPSGFIPRT